MDETNCLSKSRQHLESKKMGHGESPGPEKGREESVYVEVTPTMVRSSVKRLQESVQSPKEQHIKEDIKKHFPVRHETLDADLQASIRTALDAGLIVEFNDGYRLPNLREEATHSYSKLTAFDDSYRMPNPRPRNPGPPKFPGNGPRPRSVQPARSSPSSDSGTMSHRTEPPPSRMSRSSRRTVLRCSSQRTQSREECFYAFRPRRMGAVTDIASNSRRSRRPRRATGGRRRVPPHLRQIYFVVDWMLRRHGPPVRSMVVSADDPGIRRYILGLVKNKGKKPSKSGRRRR